MNRSTRLGTPLVDGCRNTPQIGLVSYCESLELSV